MKKCEIKKGEKLLMVWKKKFINYGYFYAEFFNVPSGELNLVCKNKNKKKFISKINIPVNINRIYKNLKNLYLQFKISEKLDVNQIPNEKIKVYLIIKNK